MSIAITIHPLDNDLDMYGEPDTTSAYSLSGHIALAVTSPYSLFEARRTARLLLQSLSLTFEGQSEVFSPSTGYSSVRLCSITRELAPSASLELSNEGHEESADPYVWNFIFNLPIPGWLPASATMGIEDTGIRYGLYVTAKFTNLEEERASSWGFASLCAPFRSRTKTAGTSRQINLRRFISPPSADLTTDVPTLNYLVNTHGSSSKFDANEARVPLEILNKIQVLASVPEIADIQDSMLPVTLRLRTKNLCEEECKKLQVTEVAIDLIQEERCRRKPSSSYTTRFPLPSQNMQPPNLPLRDPHPVASIYDVGLYMSTGYAEGIRRTFSLLPIEDAGRHTLESPNYVFANDALEASLASPTWYTMDTSIPFLQQSTATVDLDCLDWAGPANIRPSSISPLFTVQHEVVISLTCTYDLAGGHVAKDRLNFRIPLKFGKTVPRLAPSRSITPALQPSSQPTSSPVTTPEGSTASLPPYSELYDSRGERKVDYSTPLPLYSPRPTSDTSASTTDARCNTTPNPGFANPYHGATNEKMGSPLMIPDSDTPAESPPLRPTTIH